MVVSVWLTATPWLWSQIWRFFMEVLELLIEVAMPELDIEHVHNFDIDSHVKKCSKRLLDYA
jgi:hypothetical protein